MTYAEAFSSIKKLMQKADICGLDVNFAVQFNIVGDGEGIFYIANHDQFLDIAPYDYVDRDAVVIAEVEQLLKVAAGEIKFASAYENRLIEIQGNIDAVFQLDKLVYPKNDNKRRRRR